VSDAATILVVEDDPGIREGVEAALVSEGYRVLTTDNGTEGLELGLTRDPDLIVLDLMLPGLDGYDVLRRLRADAVATPVLILTARGLERDKVKGFELGADDYLVKPFGLDEFLARVAARLRVWRRERGQGGEDRLRVGDAVVDLDARTVTRGPAAAALTPTETALLRCFLRHEGRTLSRSRILDEVWADRPETTHRVVDMTVLGLRRKLESDPANPVHLCAVRGVGYRFARSAAGR